MESSLLEFFWRTQDGGVIPIYTSWLETEYLDQVMIQDMDIMIAASILCFRWLYTEVVLFTMFLYGTFQPHIHSLLWQWKIHHFTLR